MPAGADRTATVRQRLQAAPSPELLKSSTYSNWSASCRLRFAIAADAVHNSADTKTANNNRVPHVGDPVEGVNLRLRAIAATHRAQICAWFSKTIGAGLVHCRAELRNVTSRPLSTLTSARCAWHASGNCCRQFRHALSPAWRRAVERRQADPFKLRHVRHVRHMPARASKYRL